MIGFIHDVYRVLAVALEYYGSSWLCGLEILVWFRFSLSSLLALKVLVKSSWPCQSHK